MNAFYKTRVFHLVAWTTVATLSLSGTPSVKGSDSCQGYSGSFGSCRSSYANDRPSYGSYCPGNGIYQVSYCDPTYRAPATSGSYTPATGFVPLTNYAPMTTRSFSDSPTPRYPTFPMSWYQPSPRKISLYKSSYETLGNFQYKK